MPAVQPSAKVLLSGANGFIAVWTLQELLEAGYSVRGTVRSESKGRYLKERFAKYGDKLEIVVVSDITKTGAFDDAMKGIDGVLHTSSPFHFHADDPNELIGPAVDGTVRILESALKADLQPKRVVVLSSTAAVWDPSAKGNLDESSWNNGEVREVQEKGRLADEGQKYRASKTLAERAAWKYVEDHEKELSWDLVTLCPPYVYGPSIHEIHSVKNLNTSMAALFENVFEGKASAEELEFFQAAYIDVRDVAHALVLALEKEAAGGNRIIISGCDLIWQDWFDAVNNLNIPGVKAPVGTPGRGKKFDFRVHYDPTKSTKVLGIQYRDLQSCAKDIVEDFQARGWLKASASA